LPFPSFFPLPFPWLLLPLPGPVFGVVTTGGVVVIGAGGVATVGVGVGGFVTGAGGATESA
jgi:hypothetical protein